MQAEPELSAMSFRWRSRLSPSIPAKDRLTHPAWAVRGEIIENHPIHARSKLQVTFQGKNLVSERKIFLHKNYKQLFNFS